jgi:hypothetical protein
VSDETETLRMTRTEYLRAPGDAFAAASRGRRVVIVDDETGQPRMTFSPCEPDNKRETMMKPRRDLYRENKVKSSLIETCQREGCSAWRPSVTPLLGRETMICGMCLHELARTPEFIEHGRAMNLRIDLVTTEIWHVAQRHDMSLDQREQAIAQARARLCKAVDTAAAWLEDWLRTPAPPIIPDDGSPTE